MNPLGVECAGVYPHPSVEFPGSSLWMHRPEVRGFQDFGGGGGMGHRVTCAMTHEILDNYGHKPVEGPLRGKGTRRRR